jgi:hypothetical protein
MIQQFIRWMRLINSGTEVSGALILRCARVPGGLLVPHLLWMGNRGHLI